MSQQKPQQVLQDYLDALLAPATETTSRPLAFAEPEAEAEAEVEAEQQRKAQLQRLLSQAAAARAAPTAPPATPPPPVVEQTTPAAEPAPPVATAEPSASVEQALTVSAAVGPSAWADNGRPHWAQEDFDVLLVEVNGLSLAVPLISLGQIQPITEQLSPLFGQAEWFMGIQPTPMGKYRVVNTARFVMPERYDPEKAAPEYLLTIDGLPWALAVDRVDQPIHIAPDAVKWRGERHKQPWFAGVIKEQRCVLLDIPTLGDMLRRADKAAAVTS